jgi:hypothetical protein
MSLIPSESENFPESFRVKLGWHIDQQPEDPKAVAAVERLVAALPPSPPAPEAPAPAENDSPPPEANPPLASAPPTTSVPTESGTVPPLTPPVSDPPVGTSDGATEQLQPMPPPPQDSIEDEAAIEEMALAPIPTAVIETPAPTGPEPVWPDQTALPQAQELQNNMLLSGTNDNGNPTQATADAPDITADASDMAALVGHFLSAGVPISIAQPNGETASSGPTAPVVPAPVAPQPPITPQRSGFVITSGELPAMDGARSIIQPNEQRIPAQNSVGTTPIPKTVNPVAVPENRPTEEPIAEPQSNGALPSAAESVSIQTPDQAHQILQLIAAAVQRGELAGGSIAEPGPTSMPTMATPEAAPPPVPPSSATRQAVDTVKTATATTSFSPTDTSATLEKRTPAKIRITPRRIKPRSQAEMGTEPEISAEEVSHSPNNGATAELEPPKAQVAAAPARTEPLKPRPNHDRAVEHHNPTTRRVGAFRRDVAPPEFFMSSPRERRNRWIGFGLSEIAAMASLVLLGHFGFTHHFPDPTLKLLVFILLFGAATIAVALPIAFLRNDPARWGRQN